MAGGHGCSKAGRVLGLDAENPYVWFQMLERQSNPGNQAAASDWDDDGIQIWDLPGEFKAERSLAGDDRRIVKAVDIGQTFRASQLVRAFPSLANIRAMQDDGCAVPAALNDCGQGSEAGHNNRGRDAQLLCVIGEAERVIAGGRGDHAALTLGSVKEKQRIAGAALFETAGALEVFKLAEDAQPRGFGKRNR